MEQTLRRRAVRTCGAATRALAAYGRSAAIRVPSRNRVPTYSERVLARRIGTDEDALRE